MSTFSRTVVGRLFVTWVISALVDEAGLRDVEVDPPFFDLRFFSEDPFAFSVASEVSCGFLTSEVKLSIFVCSCSMCIVGIVIVDANSRRFVSLCSLEATFSMSATVDRLPMVTCFRGEILLLSGATSRDSDEMFDSVDLSRLVSTLSEETSTPETESDSSVCF